MRLDYLIDQLLGALARERMLLRRVTRYILPLLVLPLGFALAQMARSWLGLLVGALGAAALLAQVELFLRPTLRRIRVTDQDITFYLGEAPAAEPAVLVPAMALLLPTALALVVSMVIFLPALLAHAQPWQRLLALLLGMGVLWTIWQRLAQIVVLLDNTERRLVAARSSRIGHQAPDGASQPQAGSVRAPASLTPSDQDGLLDPAIVRRIMGWPLPPLLLSPAALALLRIEAYLILRDFPDTSEQALHDALAELAREAHQAEVRHWLLPPVGGKLYLPIAAHGTLATLLGATARRFGMDGGYSASLGTWLLRLPPARSYVVAGRLLDALIALRLVPPGAILPHHLTVQGDLGQESKVLSLVYLAATPLVLAERPGLPQGDERPFIMRGGGVLDDLGGRGRLHGPRTDFVDGFLFVQTPGLEGVEHLTIHTINLRIKQVLAFGLLAALRPAERRSLAEHDAARVYAQLRADLRALLERYGAAAALDIRWLDGRWSEIWPWIRRLGELKEHDPTFLGAAQQLRDAALDTIEALAIAGARVGTR